VTTDRWVTFKVVALPIASVLFMLAQMPLFKRHATSDDKRDAA
jgi:intracellular septation protein A